MPLFLSLMMNSQAILANVYTQGNYKQAAVVIGRVLQVDPIFMVTSNHFLIFLIHSSEIWNRTRIINLFLPTSFLNRWV